ncbi:MAG: alpha/beta fold hydrolase [Myxococcota bacterium]
MAQVEANGIRIEYETFGDPDDPTILLVMGLGNQLTMWHTDICESLVDQGLYVVRFDNRDIGLSEKFDHAGKPNILPALIGAPIKAPYSLDDMAADAVGLLDAIDVERAHIAGVSMGGMIAQTVAINHPDRVHSLTSIMSTTGNSSLPRGKPDAMKVLVMPPADPNDPEAVVERGLEVWRTLQSPAYPTPDELREQWIRRDYRRSYYPAGVARQLAAIIDHGDRREGLRQLDLPTVVLHGEDDPLIPVEAGEDTALVIPNSELRIIDGMGHDLPLELTDEFVDAMVTAARRA